MSGKRLTKEQKLEVAKDFYKSILSHHEIGRKYNISPNTVCVIAKSYEQIITHKEYQNDKGFALIFNEEQYLLALKILDEFNVGYIKPKNFKLTAEIESKLNFD
jgi:hypothetical protein